MSYFFKFNIHGSDTVIFIFVQTGQAGYYLWKLYHIYIYIYIYIYYAGIT